MADRIRQIAQRVKDKIHLPQIRNNSREKVDQLLTKYVPASKVSEIAEKFKHESLTNRVKELVSRYEKFTGIEEIMAIQNTVIDAQVCFCLMKCILHTIFNYRSKCYNLKIKSHLKYFK